jgi:quercetin dioxygenase-like cupin family protein
MKPTSAWLFAVAAVAVLPLAWPDAAKSPAKVEEKMLKDLVGLPGKQLRMATVEYAPGASSPPHQHHAQVAVYVLEGSLRMQVKGQPLVTLNPGDTFYEDPADVHEVSANASDTKPAKFVVFMVQDKK